MCVCLCANMLCVSGFRPSVITLLWMDGWTRLNAPTGCCFFQRFVLVSAAASTSSDPQPGTQTSVCV